LAAGACVRMEKQIRIPSSATALRVV
jgi:hypothetical protein